MSDAVLAKSIIADAFDLHPGNRSVVIGRAFNAVKAVEKQLPKEVLRDRHRQWTERRIRSIVDEEVRRVDHYEIDDLTKAAIHEARIALKRSAERATRLEAFLQRQEAQQVRPAADQSGQRLGRMDRPGNYGLRRASDEAAPDFDPDQIPLFGD